MKNILSNIKSDFPASIVVFFVALPLCLGIALASGAPLFSGIIAGIIGGIVVGFLSGSPLGVSGPAAGLAVIVFGYITTLGSFETFLLAVVLTGVIQIIAGYMRLGAIAYYFPSSVIKGMLSGIGILIILKQIPHILGYDATLVEDFDFNRLNFSNTISELKNMLNFITPEVLLIAISSLSILIIWDLILAKKHKIFKAIPSPLVAVIAGIALSNFLHLNQDQIVQIPVSVSLGGFFGQFTFPDFSQIYNPQLYMMAFVMAIVASLETLLCVEATDKLDPQLRVTPTNRELKAQGVGNIISGLIGGLPITQVIARSSANIAFGAKGKTSTILHGFLLLISAISIPSLLNMIPLATLGCVLLVVGYKLAKPEIFKQHFERGIEEFLPFIATIIGMLVFDLLIGVGIGMAFSSLFIIRNNQRKKVEEKNVIDTLTKEVRDSFTPKKAIEMLRDGNERFVKNLKLNRNLLKQVNETSVGQHPFAFVLSCMDSRTSAELIFDQGLGDIFSCRIAGNILNDDILGSMEFACEIAGAKVIVVLGHSGCGAIKGACDQIEMGKLTGLLKKIKPSVKAASLIKLNNARFNDSDFVEKVSAINVRRVMKQISKNSKIIRDLEKKSKIIIIGAMYNVTTGIVEFY